MTVPPLDAPLLLPTPGPVPALPKASRRAGREVAPLVAPLRILPLWDSDILSVVHSGGPPSRAALSIPGAAHPMPSREPSTSVPRTRRTRSAALPAGVETKLVRPNPGPEVLERPSLLEALARHAEKPVTLLIADAGYGKTTTLAAYVRTLRRPVVWYSLMPSDADLVVFCRCLLAGIRREYPRFGRAFEQAVEEARPGGRSAEMLAGTLANQLAALRAPGVVVILDDYQEIAAHPPIGAFMATLLRQFPAGLRLIVAARSTLTGEHLADYVTISS